MTFQQYTNYSRRSLLGGIAAGISASLAGCTNVSTYGGESDGNGESGASGAGSDGVATALDPGAYADRFETVTNLVEDHGADPTGEEPIGDALSSAWSDDTLIVLPQGDYKLNSQFRRTRSRDVGLIGQNAVIRHGEVESIHSHTVGSGEYSGSTMMFRVGTDNTPHRGEFVFGGFIFDWSRENSGMQGINAHVDGDLEIRNILFNGMHDLGTHGNMRVATHSPESTGLVDSIDMRWGGLHHENTINTRRTTDYAGGTNEYGLGQSWSTSGITGHPQMQGTIHFNNIQCGGWPDNGIYVRGGSGRKILTNCHAANSGVASLRTDSGPDWEPVEYLDETDDYDEARDGPYGQSTLENCIAEVDHTPDERTYGSQRGIRLRGGEFEVRNCHVRIGVDDGAGGAGGSYAIGALDGTERATVTNTSVELTEPGDAFYFTSGFDVELEGIEIQTTGWDGTRSNVFGGATPSMNEVVLNGELIG
ncbi:hypothetical protein [Natronococcus sp. A-GB7]|uniref:hypothetical protein n=1 Tax=Natronococcus sp. A-GB7 TaxID=3037649 RepID=UPI00241C9F65|nr:hypothetical protein [Natronococcus sp. A-GB7]MDG5821634.1 hypothetical protein [Natronococcus sp. A-GB7]